MKKTFRNNRFLFLIFFAMLIIDIALISYKKSVPQFPSLQTNTWPLQSIDTVKYSRDIARQYAKDESFDATIDAHMSAIAGTGANYVALGTPYDKEFIPYLERWVNSARKRNLKIWFRGNFSGWEGWFEYPRISRDKHKDLLEKFILDNGHLFKDGDLFTSCTECENGGPGDPRNTGDVGEYRKFLIDEYQISRKAFTQIGKNVATNYYPMNFDVALLIMDQETTRSLGGKVVIDHYVATPEILIKTIKALEDSSGGKIVLGEFGAPIPDIHGQMSDDQQAEWINTALTELSKDENVVGVNYWTAFGGSTRIWRANGEALPAVKILKSFYSPKNITGVVQNEAGVRIKNAEVGHGKSVKTNASGGFLISYPESQKEGRLVIKAPEYYDTSVALPTDDKPIVITLKKLNENFIFKVEKLIYRVLKI